MSGSSKKATTVPVVDGLVIGADTAPNQVTEQPPDGRSKDEEGRRLLVQARRFMRNKAAFKVFLEENMLVCLIKDAEDLVKSGNTGQQARNRFFDRGGLVLRRMDSAGQGGKRARKVKGHPEGDLSDEQP